jgi:4-amino-4-deoxy-L-arabinose transferase-like glycosyltransferase
MDDYRNGEPFPPRPTLLEAAEMRRRQRGRNVALGLVLGALAVLFFAITIVKLSHA